ncbi:glycine-rich cell wall structural protein 1.0-like [Salvia hispanica]|uniref:glycine-rich cell wall structural protein 1.0-like n=1 Tax=Salvia hispanica TaxID=49212 RepID=UPI002009452B|nr:glycine-rich cell wall structural protein 1.0-like [Salvia hispanica]
MLSQIIVLDVAQITLSCSLFVWEISTSPTTTATTSIATLGPGAPVGGAGELVCDGDGAGDVGFDRAGAGTEAGGEATGAGVGAAGGGGDGTGGGGEAGGETAGGGDAGGGVLSANWSRSGDGSSSRWRK